MWFDRMTRWRNVGCGSGKRVPEPFTPLGIKISEELFRAANAHI